MNDLVLTALFTENLERAIRHHFVRVHVRRSAGAALYHVDAEMVVVQPFSDLARRLRDGVDDLAIEQLHLQVGERRRFLHTGERGDERWKLAQLYAADGEILD